jgi:hypothetical protein
MVTAEEEQKPSTEKKNHDPKGNYHD